MGERLVSIIIPAYKTEKYVDECIQSALEQNYPNVEIILVDDGSPDRCPQIFDEYAARYENVKAVHQKNQGQGIARNTGVQNAKGDYVFMMDSDDRLDGPDAIRYLMEEAERSGADIIVGNYRKFRDEMIWDKNRHHLKPGEYQETPKFRFDGFYRFGHLAYNWGKLYRRAFLVENALWSKNYPFTQDKANNILCYAYHPKYAFIDQSVYLYRINDESITFRYKPNMKSVWIAIAKDFHQELAERGVKDDFWDITAFHIFFGSFFLVKQEFMAGHGFWKAKREVEEFGKDPFVRKSMKELAAGKYLRGIGNFPWRVFIRLASMLFAIHGYFLFTLGIAMLRGMKIDYLISDKRNRRKKTKNGAAQKQGEQSLAAEAELLCRLLSLALTGKALGEEEKRRLKSADLASIFHIADEHRVLPMFYDLFEEMEEELPEELVRQLETSTERTVNQSYRLLFMTKALTDMLAAEGISAIALKGCGIASYYPIPEYRKSGDVDLLFPDMESVYRAGKILETKGCIVKEEQHANHHVVYQGPDGVDLELHAMLAEPFDDERINKRMEELLSVCFAEKTVTDSMGLSIPTLSERLQALELLLHMLQHFLRAGFGLKLLTDWVVFWNKVRDEKVAEQFRKLAAECGVEGFAKAVTLLCEKYLGLDQIHIFGEALEQEFSKNYAARFMMDVIQAEEFGKSDKNRMVALRKRGLWGYVKEFHYQMRMNYATESKKVWKWPYLWLKTFRNFLRNNRRLGRGSLRSILKNAGERASVVEEMRLFKKK